MIDLVKPGNVGVEVGVLAGESAWHFLRLGTSMHLVDPYVRYAEEFQTYLEWGGNGSDPELGMNIMLRNLDKFRNSFVLHRLMSDDPALPSLLPDQVDFAFVDGNHRRRWVDNDVRLLWPRINKGGFLTGHDYGVRRDQDGVVEVVHDLLRRERVNFYRPVRLECWVVQKP
jgi:hypothetical protein